MFHHYLTRNSSHRVRQMKKVEVKIQMDVEVEEKNENVTEKNRDRHSALGSRCPWSTENDL